MGGSPPSPAGGGADRLPARSTADRPGVGSDAAARRAARAESASERLLRSLVSTRPTQLTPTAAMRAREVAAPTAADLARAEAELTIVRRNYVPPAPLTTVHRTTRGRRADGTRSDGSADDRQDGRNGGSGSS